MSNLNMTKSKILKLALGIMSLMILFPPYELMGLGSAIVLENGYAFILKLPECYRSLNNCGFNSRVDITRLLMQIIICGVVAFVAAKALNGKQK